MKHGLNMAVLSPESLMELLNLSEESVDCAGLRLHLDKVFRFRGRGLITKTGKNLPEVEEVEPRDGFFHLEHGTYRIRYAEIVKVPSDCIALAIPRSTLLRMGVALYTAVWDPGYEGRGEGLLTVFNPYGVAIERGAQVAQLVFIKMDRATSRLYRGTYYRENITE